MEEEKKRIKELLKKIGKTHVDMLKIAFGRDTIGWLDWPKNMLANKTPAQAINDGEVEKVRSMIGFLYDLSTLPKDEEEEVLATEEEED